MVSAKHVLTYVGLLIVLQGATCTGSTPTTSPPPPSPSLVTCPGAMPPSVSYGSKDLAPTFGAVNLTPIVSKTAYVTMSGPPNIQLDPGGPFIGDVLEICIMTSPPAVNTHLGVKVTGVLEDPNPAGGASGPVNFWQNVFATYFIRPLQDNQTASNGVLKLDVPALSLRNAIINPPPGYSSGRMLITIDPGNGPHRLDLTIAPK